MTDSCRITISEDYPDAKRCPAVVRLSWTYPGSPQRRERIRCKRRRGHAGHTHVAVLHRWNVPWPAQLPADLRWVA